MMFPGRKAMNMERVYKTMRNTGAGCIAIGVIIAVTGLTVGIISIVNGALPVSYTHLSLAEQGICIP